MPESLAIREQTFNADPIPVYPFKFVIPAAGFMLLLQDRRSSAASNASRPVSGRRGRVKKSRRRKKLKAMVHVDEDMAGDLAVKETKMKIRKELYFGLTFMAWWSLPRFFAER
jgi:hypothetical protein